MSKELISKLITSPELKDIPTIYVVRIIFEILKLEI